MSDSSSTPEQTENMTDSVCYGQVPEEKKEKKEKKVNIVCSDGKCEIINPDALLAESLRDLYRKEIEDDSRSESSLSSSSSSSLSSDSDPNYRWIALHQLIEAHHALCIAFSKLN